MYWKALTRKTYRFIIAIHSALTYVEATHKRRMFFLLYIILEELGQISYYENMTFEGDKFCYPLLVESKKDTKIMLF